MKPSDILKNEHRVIEQVLNCLEVMTEKLVAARTLNPQHAKDAAAFFRAFADQCHHGKEEVHFFPMMEARGFSREGGPTGVMLQEHDLGRAHVRGFNESVDKAAAGDPESIRQFIYHARAFIQLLREHIQKEDHCLFSMADQAFSEKDQTDLMQQFERVEEEEMGAGTHEKFLALANELADYYNVRRAEISGDDAHAAFACSHHHH